MVKTRRVASRPRNSGERGVHHRLNFFATSSPIRRARSSLSIMRRAWMRAARPSEDRLPASCGSLGRSRRVTSLAVPARRVHRRCDIDRATRTQEQNAPPARARPASPFSFRGLAPIAAVIPVRMRVDPEHAVDASNDSTSRSANNPTNKATDRSEHAVTGVGTAVCPVFHPTRHALRLPARPHSRTGSRARV